MHSQAAGEPRIPQNEVTKGEGEAQGPKVGAQGQRPPWRPCWGHHTALVPNQGVCKCHCDVPPTPGPELWEGGRKPRSQQHAQPRVHTHAHARTRAHTRSHAHVCTRTGTAAPCPSRRDRRHVLSFSSCSRRVRSHRRHSCSSAQRKVTCACRQRWCRARLTRCTARRRALVPSGRPAAYAPHPRPAPHPRAPWATHAPRPPSPRAPGARGSFLPQGRRGRGRDSRSCHFNPRGKGIRPERESWGKTRRLRYL